MSEVLSRRWERILSTRPLSKLGLAAVSAAFGASIGAAYFDHSTAHTEIAAAETSVSPNLGDDHITFHGGILPDIRIPSELPAGAGLDITFGNSTIPSGGMASDNGKRLLAAVTAVAAQPSGEEDKVRGLLMHQLLEAGEVGAGAMLIPIGAYVGLGERRRKELLEKRGVVGTMGLIGILAVTSGSSVQPQATDLPVAHWVPISRVFPELSSFPELQKVEIRDSAVVGIAANLAQGAFVKYEQSKVFYDALEQTVRDASELFHQPEEGQTVALLISDRHDNIGMDPVLAATAESGGASIVIDAGDDTSSGQAWETFSLRSLVTSFKGYDVWAIGGNHDNDGGDDYVIHYLKQRGAITPNGKVQSIDGMAVLMANDPRRSDYTPERAEGDISFGDAAEEVRELACASDKRVNLIVVHDKNMGRTALEDGCADVVVAGHTHVYADPVYTTGANGDTGVTINNGTSGGAFFSISFGTDLRHEASAVLLTFDEDKRLIGSQHIKYTTKGEAEIDPYIPIRLSPLNENDALKHQRQEAQLPAA